MDDVSPELQKKYNELDALIQEVARMEGVPEKGIVSQWIVVAGVLEFNDQDSFVDNDVMCLTPNAGMSTPVWQAKGLLDSGLTKYRALEHLNFQNQCDHDHDEDEGN